MADDGSLSPLTIVLLATLLVGVGCTLAGAGAGQRLQIQTDGNHYTFGSGDRVRVTVRNVGAHPVHYNTCLPTVLDAIDSTGRKTETPLPVCRCECPATVAPGDTVEPGRTSVPVATLRRHLDSLNVSKEGVYRLRYAFYRDEGQDELLPAAVRRTPPFRLEAP